MGSPPPLVRNPKDEITVELEQRVKLLEQEVKLLKNEVQATLLDIQEQLLSTRYPGLRAEASHQPETVAAVAGAFVDERPPAKPAPLMLLKTAPSIEPLISQPPTKPQSAASGNGGPPVTAALPPAPKPIPNAAPASTRLSEKARREVQAKVAAPINWKALTQQTDWTIQMVRQHGLEHTRRLIEVYAQEGLLSEKAGVILQHVAASFQADSLSAEIRPDKETANGANGKGTSDKAGLRNTIVRIINYLQSAGASQETPHG